LPPKKGRYDSVQKSIYLDKIETKLESIEIPTDTKGHDVQLFKSMENGKIFKLKTVAGLP